MEFHFEILSGIVCAAFGGGIGISMKKSTGSVLLGTAGVLLICIGLIFLKTQTAMISLPYPYICIGIGCGIFGHGMGNILSLRATKNHPAIEKQMEIEKNDERNQAIAYRSKAKAYDCMVFVFGALMLTFALMEKDIQVILLLVFSYLFVIGCGLFYRFKYDKEM